MNLKKRLISLLLAVVLLACLIPPVNITAQAAVSGYEIVSYARRYIGYPYKHGAKGPNAFDCSGFVYYVFKHFGIELPSGASNIYSNASKIGTVVAKGSVANAQMGDIISWNGHAAIYTEDGYCVEALGTKYGVLEKYKVDRHKSNGKNYKVIRVNGVKALDVPKVSSLTNTASGVEIKWDTIKHAEKYRVLRKTGGGSWASVGTTTAASFVDKTAASGATYSYTVRCVSNDGNSYTSTFDEKGKSIKYIAAPKLSAATNTATGVNISWGKVDGAEKYRIYYKTALTGWTKIADTTATNYNWTGAKSGTKYSFTVRCINSAGTAYTGDFDAKGLSLTYLPMPKIVSISKENSGVVLKWSNIAGATKYRVYYKNSDGKWITITDTAATSYTWKGAKNGTKYTFSVRCVSDEGSAFDGIGKSFTPVANPKLSKVSNTAAGVKISWGKVSGAEKYRVYYKTASTGWTKLADTTSASYVWAGAKSGTAYKFTVRCLTGDGSAYASGFDEAGLGITYIAAPKLSVSAENAGTVIKWNKVAGATKYRVFYKTGDGAWTKIADTAETSYTWKGAKVGTKYTYTVKCINGDGSGYDSAGKSLVTVAVPKLSAVSSTTSGVKISWGKVSGAKKYKVYYKTASAGWTKIADTASTNYVWTDAKSGTAYTFTVRCVTEDGKTYTSGFDTAGLRLTYIAAPKLKSVCANGNGTTLTWEKVNGAELYRVFRKTAGGSWEKLADTTAGSYTDKSAKLGSGYYYTVRCVSNDLESYLGAYNSAGIRAVGEPKLPSLTKTANGITISWGKVANAEKYRVFYKANGESTWHKAGDTTATSYTWTGAKSGTKYTFTVRCVSSDGTAFTSSYNKTGKSVDYIAAPKISSLSNTANGVQINWGKVAGAAKYRVFYRANGESTWHTIGDTASTSYTWTGAKRGTKYSFTVRCVANDGTFISSYDGTGKSITH